MPLHPFGSNNVVVQLCIFIDTPGADTPWDWTDVSADASSVEKSLFLDQGGLLPCGRWWLLEVVSSLDLQIFLFLKPYITLVMWLALWFPLQKNIDRLLLCKLSYFADLIQDSGRAISP